MVKKGVRPPELEREEGMLDGGGREVEEKTEYWVAFSSRIVSARVPISQLLDSPQS